MIRLQFVLGASYASRAIAWFSAGGRSGFSHVDCVLPDGRLLGARADKHGEVPAGVQVRPPDYEKWAKRVVFELDARSDQEQRYYDFLNAQLGKGYDHLAIVGFITGRSWTETDTWICSELQAAALMGAGLCSKLYLTANQITPTMLALLVSGLGAKTV